MSFSAYTKPLTTNAIREDEIPLNLVLPEPLRLTDKEVVWSVEEYANILKIYSGYIYWADTFLASEENISISEFRLELCTERLQLKEETINLLSEDREHIYRLYGDEINNSKDAEFTNSLKLVLVSAGVGVVGIAVGIIIGVFAI